MVWKALPRLKIAVQCHADWNAMVGNDKVRFCGQCCQNVYNVRNLRPREVAALVEKHGERMPCLRLYQRPDGTVITRSCLDWVRAGVHVVRLSVWSVAALAVGFWAQVLVWHARLHPRRPSLELTTSVGEPRERPPVVPPPAQWLPPRPTFERHVTMGLPAREPTPGERQPRESGGPTEAGVRAAMVEVSRALKDARQDLQRNARVDIEVEVRPNGRVRRVRVVAPPEVTAAIGKRVEAAVKRVRFPRSVEDYQAEFTIILQD